MKISAPDLINRSSLPKTRERRKENPEPFIGFVVKHVLDLPDTLHPNTYASILYLAAFTLVVATVGTGCGVLVRRLAIGPVRRDQGPA